MRAIFISYRRDDTEGEAGRLFGDLGTRFGQRNVFMDVAALEAGRDFRKELDKTVESCGVLLSIVGRNWLTIADDKGNRRLDDPDDFVRLETASALRRDIPVIPVLVHGARMPRVEQLPEDLKEFAYRNAVELTHARWGSDIKLLEDALARALDRNKEFRSSLRPHWWTKPIFWLIALCVIVAAALPVYFFRGKKAIPDAAQTPAAAAAAPASGPSVQTDSTPQNQTQPNPGSQDQAQANPSNPGQAQAMSATLAQASIAAKYVLLGGTALSSVKINAAAGNGFFADVENGYSIYYTPATGPHFVRGAIKAKWLDGGGPASPLGYPATDEISDGKGGFFQKFSNGTITWTAEGGAVVQPVS